MMAPPYSNGTKANSYDFHIRNHQRELDSTSLLDDLRSFIARCIRSMWRFWNERGRYMAFAAMVSFARQVRLNLTARRLLSFPHLLVGIWVIVMLWGERWVYHSRVESCHWSNWENWVRWPRPRRAVLRCASILSCPC